MPDTKPEKLNIDVAGMMEFAGPYQQKMSKARLKN